MTQAIAGERRHSTRTWALIHLAGLAGAVVAEIVFYPALATMIFGLFGGATGPGSSMGYFRSHSVVPAAVAFAIAVSVGFVLVWNASPAVFRRVVIGTWILNALALVLSSLWYFHVVDAASGAGTP